MATIHPRHTSLTKPLSLHAVVQQLSGMSLVEHMPLNTKFREETRRTAARQRARRSYRAADPWAHDREVRRTGLSDAPVQDEGSGQARRLSASFRRVSQHQALARRRSSTPTATRTTCGAGCP